jgi:hypothetical protein
MTTVQIAGIAVAAAVVVLLVVALVVTRRRGDRTETAPEDASFFDVSPQDTFAGLGRAEEPVEDVTLEPRAVRSLRHDLEAGGPPPRAAAAEDTTGEIAPAVVPPQGPARRTADPRGATNAPWGPPREEDAAMAAAATGPPIPQAPDRRVPLADIIVTTSRKVVDLDDPEVRRMLKDLVKFEIDQATRYREQGQYLDAALQLTEAEKISRALGMGASADAIRQMMTDLRG